MTENEKYNVLLQELAMLLKGKNMEIEALKYRVKALEEKLEEAEYHLNPCGKAPRKPIETR